MSSESYHNTRNSSGSQIIAEDLERFTPTLTGYMIPVFVIVVIFLAILAILVQRAVYKVLNNLDDRPINAIIKPTMVMNSITISPYFFTLLLKAIHYPLKDITGENLCFFLNYFDQWFNMINQFQTFFITLFRYVCIFHMGRLYKKGLTPKVTFQNFNYKNHFCGFSCFSFLCHVSWKSSSFP